MRTSGVGTGVMTGVGVGVGVITGSAVGVGVGSSPSSSPAHAGEANASAVNTMTGAVMRERWFIRAFLVVRGGRVDSAGHAAACRRAARTLASSVSAHSYIAISGPVRLHPSGVSEYSTRTGTSG